MASRNDVTGDNLVSRSNTNEYRSNWDKIFGNKKESDTVEESQDKKEESEK